MHAADLAREVHAYNTLRDRPSRLVLVVGPVGAIRARKDTSLQVTAPVENGHHIMRISIPDYPPPRSWRTVLDYDSTNLEGVATCIEGHMLNYGFFELRLLEVAEGEFFENNCLLGKWTWRGDDLQTHSSLQRMLSILKTLLLHKDD